MSFLSGKYPEKGETSIELNNYLPISLLSIFDKIIEKLMHKRLYNFLNEHNILFSNQFGFRNNKSTSLALIQITENGKYGCGMFIDLLKAFYTFDIMALGESNLNGLNPI